MPNAMSKEGFIMYVQSTYEVNTNQQLSPFVPQPVGHTTPVKTPSGLTFKEHLNRQFQQASVQAVSRDAENQVAGIFWGFLPLLRVQTKPEPSEDDER